MGNSDNNAVVSPLLASGLLGSGIYGSHRLDNYLDSIGLSKGLTFNPKAVKAINAYGNLTPDKVKDPSKYIYHYSDAASRASKAQLFNEDPRKTWEWFSNNEKLTDSISGLARKNKMRISNLRNKGLPRLSDFLSKFIRKSQASSIVEGLDNRLLWPAQAYLSGAEAMLSPIRKQLNRRRTPDGKSTEIRRLAHEAEIGKSRAGALLRLMMESMDKDNGLGTPERLAKNTAEAIGNWSKRVYGVGRYGKGRKGRDFNSALEYFNYLTRNKINSTEYADYIAHFKGLEGKKLSRKELLEEVRKLLAPNTYKPGTRLGKEVFLNELRQSLGSTGKWIFDDTTGKLVQGRKYRLRDGVRNVDDMQKIINKSPILTWMRSGIKYEGAPFKYIFNALRTAQALRNPKLRVALGLGSAGLGALGLSNLGRNIFSKEQMA